MSYFTDEQVFGPFGGDHEPRRLVVQANGGTIVISAHLTGSTYIPFETISVDSADLIAVAGTQIKITPSGGAVYNFGPGD